MTGTYLIAIENVGAEIKARIDAGDKAMDKAEQHYVAAGIQLLEAHKRLKETREMRWSAFLFSHARISDTQARRYMALANGDTSLEEIREASRRSVRETRARKSHAQAQIEKSPYVGEEITQQNQCDDHPHRARLVRIVEALPAASLDVIIEIERLLKIEE